MDPIPLFGWAYQHNLSAVEQCFSLTVNQPQLAYKPKKQPAEQGQCLFQLVLKFLKYRREETTEVRVIDLVGAACGVLLQINSFRDPDERHPWWIHGGGAGGRLGCPGDVHPRLCSTSSPARQHPCPVLDFQFIRSNVNWTSCLCCVRWREVIAAQVGRAARWFLVQGAFGARDFWRKIIGI
jgi:hypothetical protein